MSLVRFAWLVKIVYIFRSTSTSGWPIRRYLRLSQNCIIFYFPFFFITLSSTVIIITAPGGGPCPSEGWEAMRVRRVLFPRAQSLRYPHVRVRQPAGPSGLQQPPGLLLPPACGLPAAVFRVSTAAGPGLVEIPSALPRDHVQGRDVFWLGWCAWRGLVARD